MTYEELIKDARKRLGQAQVPDPATDAFLLLSKAGGGGAANYFAMLDQKVSNQVATAYEELLQRRIGREPLQLILGDTGFMGLKFFVDGKELIPRSDTEILVQEALEIWHKRYESGEKELTALDLCTGSGCIAISLAHYGSFKKVGACDISEEALENARKNAGENKAEIDFRSGDLFAPFEGERFDLICSNPPYIKRDEIPYLQPEVRDYDPHIALDGGEDGLDSYRRIASQAAEFMNEKASLCLEIGADQAKDVEKIFAEAGYKNIRIIKDYAGNDRVVICENGI